MTQTTPKIFVFVLMPFDTKFDDIYELGIKAACSDAGAYCERVDEQIFEESILNRIYNQISKADLLIADMTGRNHNVFYEVGYAHALGKRVFLLTQSSDDIPFDLKHYPHIVYDGRISELKSELTKRIRWAIENPEDVEKYLKTRIEVSINTTPLVDNPQIHNWVKSEKDKKYSIELEIDFHNSTKYIIEPVSFQIGMIAPIKTSGSYYNDDFRRTRIKVSDTTCLLLIDNMFKLLPGAWDKYRFTLLAEDNQYWKIGEQFELILRIFLPNGPHDYPFTVKIEEKKL